jgi:GH35 family endo-1,4-beta-xylanase
MTIRTLIHSIFAVACAIAILPAAAQTGASALHLEKRGQVTQLIVNGEPYLALAGELGNSTATDLEHMKPIWGRLTAMNLNTVLPAISWALTEPEEGQFDFTLIDGLIEEARRHNVKLVPLWFGGWKNT